MALTKPRRTHETSGAMDSRSMTGPFFEVPTSLRTIATAPDGATGLLLRCGAGQRLDANEGGYDSGPAESAWQD